MAIEQIKTLDRAFQALAHQTRRQILERLIDEPGVSAGTFAAQFDVAQPTVSRHLQQLERAGLVTRRVVGRSHVFFANAQALSTVDAWIADHRAFWAGSIQRLGQFLDQDST
jgi:DNA-binding transcriptional ArsR family regulator